MSADAAAQVHAPLTIDIISDVMCPWCYIGKRRLERALERMDDLSIRVAWHPFQLDPTLPPQGKDRQDYLSEKFGGPDEAATVYDRIAAAGEQEGIAFAFDRIERSPNTLDAHRLIRWAGIEGVQDALVERLFALYFVEGNDIADHKVLQRAAGEVGMDEDVVARLLASEADLSETEADALRARAMGVEGVPCFIVAGRYAISGAQPPEVLEQALREAASELALGLPG